VEIAEDDVIDSAGVDRRPVIENPIDRTKVIDLESAVDRILSELRVSIPGSEINTQNFMPKMFSLGYFSLSKRRMQSYMQPVFVAQFVDRGETSLNRLIVIPATSSPYEPICRILEPPRKIENRSLQLTTPSSVDNTNLCME
jgi:hypothetical protein